MDYVLPGLVTLVILLFLLRRQIKRAWTGKSLLPREDSNKTFADIVAREKEQAKGTEGTSAVGQGDNGPGVAGDGDSPKGC